MSCPRSSLTNSLRRRPDANFNRSGSPPRPVQAPMWCRRKLALDRVARADLVAAENHGHHPALADQVRGLIPIEHGCHQSRLVAVERQRPPCRVMARDT
jgi:hypothetical protein